MATDTTLMGLLKSPSQVRREQQDRLMEESLARSQMMLRGIGGGTTALPGIISSYGAQAAQRGAQAGAGLLRGVSGGIGQMVGGETGQRIADLGVPMEERQARSAQNIMSNLNSKDVESLRSTATQLRQLGLPGAAEQLENRASTLVTETRESDLRRVPLSKLTGIPANVLQSYDADAVRKANQIKIQGPQEGETEEQFIGRVNQALGETGDVGSLEEILQSVPFDPKDAATYYATVAKKLIDSGDANLAEEGYKYLERAQKERDRLKEDIDTDVDLDVRTRQAILEETTEADNALSRANTATRLATEYNTLAPVGGAPGQVREAFLSVVGGQDELSILREDVAGLAASRAISRIPPGPASDKDILFAGRGFPSEFTNAKTMEKYLRGYAKMEALKAAYHEHRANFLAENPSAAGHPKAWREYRDANMATILSDYGFTFNDQTIEQELESNASSGSRINVSDDFETLGNTPSVTSQSRQTRAVGGRSRAARGR